MAIWKYVGQGNCLALVLRSEGLKALPLITTSVTRHVKVDLHVVEKQEEKEHDSLCKCKRFLYQVLTVRE